MSELTIEERKLIEQIQKLARDTLAPLLRRMTIMGYAPEYQAIVLGEVTAQAAEHLEGLK